MGITQKQFLRVEELLFIMGWTYVGNIGQDQSVYLECTGTFFDIRNGYISNDQNRFCATSAVPESHPPLWI